MAWFLGFALLAFVVAATSCGGGDPGLVLTELGSYDHGDSARGGAEIAAYDAGSKRLFVVNNAGGRSTLDVLDLARPASPKLAQRIDVRALHGGGANSVASRNGVVALAIENGADRQAPGWVVFLDPTGRVLGRVVAGAVPDMLTFTPDGRTVVVVNEGEPDESYAHDPEGSVSLVDLANGPARATVTTLGFTAFDANGPRHAELPPGVRVYGPGASVAQDLEPEYVAIAKDGRRAWVSLQENNALAVVDLAERRITKIVALGLKDHRQAGSGIDPSDQDGGHRVGPWPVYGMYQPDALATFTAAGHTWILCANEGDARGYAGMVEEARVAELRLDRERFPNAERLVRPEALGRLRVSRLSGDVDGDGDFDELHAFGARSISILDDEGTRVWDSGDLLERLAAVEDPGGLVDDRGDDRGPEPEGLAIGVVGGRTYAFVGFERRGGVVVFDVTDPRAPVFQDYADPRAAPRVPRQSWAAAEDEGPEGVLFIPPDASPIGKPLLVVCNEVSGTTTIYGVEPGRGDVTPVARARGR
jgi:hypothetical protein